MAEKPKRVAKNISLPPDLAKRLDTEAEARLLNPSLLVEKALERFFEALEATEDGS